MSWRQRREARRQGERGEKAADVLLRKLLRILLVAVVLFAGLVALMMRYPDVLHTKGCFTVPRIGTTCF